MYLSESACKVDIAPAVLPGVVWLNSFYQRRNTSATPISCSDGSTTGVRCCKSCCVRPPRHGQNARQHQHEMVVVSQLHACVLMPFVTPSAKVMRIASFVLSAQPSRNSIQHWWYNRIFQADVDSNPTISFCPRSIVFRLGSATPTSPTSKPTYAGGTRTLHGRSSRKRMRRPRAPCVRGTGARAARPGMRRLAPRTGKTAARASAPRRSAGYP
jgi:hypothetical protein